MLMSYSMLCWIIHVHSRPIVHMFLTSCGLSIKLMELQDHVAEHRHLAFYWNNVIGGENIVQCWLPPIGCAGWLVGWRIDTQGETDVADAVTCSLWLQDPTAAAATMTCRVCEPGLWWLTLTARGLTQLPLALFICLDCSSCNFAVAAVIIQ